MTPHEAVRHWRQRNPGWAGTWSVQDTAVRRATTLLFENEAGTLRIRGIGDVAAAAYRAANRALAVADRSGPAVVVACCHPSGYWVEIATVDLGGRADAPWRRFDDPTTRRRLEARTRRELLVLVERERVALALQGVST